MFGEKIDDCAQHKIVAFRVVVSTTVETKCSYIKWTTHLCGLSNTFPIFYPLS